MDEKYILINDIDESEARLLFSWIDSLADKAKATIEILSHGGLCFVGTGVAQKIIEAQTRGIEFTAKVYGIVASAASDIALACTHIHMAMGAQLMIHSAWNEFLDPDDQGIIRANQSQLALIHRKLPGYTAEDLKQDRWLNAEEAVRLGVADGYIKLDDVMATLHKVAAKYNSFGGKTMKEVEKTTVKAEVEAPVVKAEAPCNDEEKKDEMKADDGASAIDVMEQVVQRLEAIEHRLDVLEGEGKKADDEGEAESGDQIAARLNRLYARLTGDTKAEEKPVVATSGKVSKKQRMEASFERSKKIDLKSFM
jgi:ATP-dependent protease ClpP protease subunit